jgi:hypothetical protein
MIGGDPWGPFASQGSVLVFTSFMSWALVPTFYHDWGFGGRGWAAQLRNLSDHDVSDRGGALIALAGLIFALREDARRKFAPLISRRWTAPLSEERAPGGPIKALFFALLLFGFGILVSALAVSQLGAAGLRVGPRPANAMLHAGRAQEVRALYGLLKVAPAHAALGARSSGYRC